MGVYWRVTNFASNFWHKKKNNGTCRKISATDPCDPSSHQPSHPTPEDRYLTNHTCREGSSGWSCKTWRLPPVASKQNASSPSNFAVGSCGPEMHDSSYLRRHISFQEPIFLLGHASLPSSITMTIPSCRQTNSKSHSWNAPTKQYVYGCFQK